MTTGEGVSPRDRVTGGRCVEVLVGMSVAEIASRRDLAAAARRRGAEVAYLQHGDPSLGAALARAVDGGASEVRLVGVDLAGSAPGVSWLRRVVAHWTRTWSGDPVVVAVAERHAVDLADDIGIDERVASARPLNGREAGLTSAAWERVPSHRHQVFVCRGPRCAAAGGAQTQRAIVAALAERGLGDDDVLVTVTGCQFPCNHAPLVSVQPDDVWYGRVDATAAARLVAEHLVDGVPVEEHRLPR